MQDEITEMLGDVARGISDSFGISTAREEIRAVMDALPLIGAEEARVRAIRILDAADIGTEPEDEIRSFGGDLIRTDAFRSKLREMLDRTMANVKASLIETSPDDTPETLAQKIADSHPRAGFHPDDPEGGAPKAEEFLDMAREMLEDIQKMPAPCEPDADAKPIDLTQFLREQGVANHTLAQVVGVFGKAVADAYRERHGHEPWTRHDDDGHKVKFYSGEQDAEMIRDVWLTRGGEILEAERLRHDRVTGKSE